MKTNKRIAFALITVLALTMCVIGSGYGMSRLRPKPPPPVVVVEPNTHIGAGLIWDPVLEGRNIEQFWTLVEALGIKLVRYEIHASVVENGDWSRADEFFAGRPEDVDGEEPVRVILSVFNDGTNLKRTLAEHRLIRQVFDEIMAKKGWANVSIDGMPPSSPPADPDKYAKLIQEIVMRYEPQGLTTITIESEIYRSQKRHPDLPLISRMWCGSKEDYVAMFKLAHTTVRDMNANVEVVPASLTLEPWPRPLPAFFRYVIDECWLYITVLDIHFYECPDDDAAKLKLVRDCVSRYSLNTVEYICTETMMVDENCEEFDRFKGVEWSEEEEDIQALEYPRRIKGLLDLGIRDVVMLRGCTPDNPKEGKGRWTGGSLCDVDGVWRKVAEKIRILILTGEVE
jgi:hypothetical protein